MKRKAGYIMERFKSKVEIIYEKLKEDITSGVYKPGDRIIISQIARQNQISDIPVREAIRLLESDGLIRIQANVGPIVTDLEEGDVLQHFMIKGVLEGYAARLSIDYLTGENLSELEKLNEAMKEAVSINDLKEYGILNRQFHCDMYKVIPYTQIYNMIMELWDKWGRTRSVFVLAPERVKESIEEHNNILDLIREKKYDELEFYVRQHKMRASEKLVDSIKQRQIIGMSKK
jgi:DNA-binding GntR family transcriptional regulator